MKRELNFCNGYFSLLYFWLDPTYSVPRNYLSDLKILAPGQQDFHINGDGNETKFFTVGWGIAANCDGGGSCHVLIRIERRSETRDKVVNPKYYKHLKQAAQ